MMAISLVTIEVTYSAGRAGPVPCADASAPGASPATPPDAATPPDTVAGPRFTTVPGGACAFEETPSDDLDDLSDAGTGGSPRPARGLAIALHHTGPSQTSPKTGTARGPPVRTGRLHPGASRPHHTRQKKAGVNRPHPREDRVDARTTHPEDP
ncbi:hypothetical protein ABZV14_43175 [Streptosporangium canum]|uniref:hypothetical protein n=1 Tax=Streptosporangium canum TaxID=324952 RepID=UPI0033BC6E6E